MRKSNPIKFCTHCGKPVSMVIPEGDNRERHVCLDCGEIQYQNPKIITGCIPIWQDKILICKRAIEPRYGTWTIPAGFMENDETIEQGAIRETYEEALAEVSGLQLFQIFNLTRVNQIYILFLANLANDTDFGAGPESLDVKLVDEDQIPWQGISFRVIEHTLRRYLRERVNGSFSVSMDSMD